MTHSSEPILSIAFPTKDRLELLTATLQDIRRDIQDIDYEIVIVDGQSKDGTTEYLASQIDVVLIREERLEGCRKAFNTALLACRGKYICWLNDDITLAPGAINMMLRFMDDPANADVGIGAFPVSTSSERLDRHVFNCFGYPPIPYADMGMIRRKTLEAVGYLDDCYKRFGWDPALSLKIWELGLTVRICPNAHVTHYFFGDHNRTSHEYLRDQDTQTLERLWSAKLPALAEAARTTLASDETTPYLLRDHKARAFLFLENFEALRALIQEDESLVSSVYALGLDAHRKGDLRTAQKTYETICSATIQNKDILAWAHFKLAEIQLNAESLTEAKHNLKHALLLKPDLDKAKILLADRDAPLLIAFGNGDKIPAGAIQLTANPFDIFAWQYLFEFRKPDAVYLHGEKIQLAVEDVIANAVTYLPPDGKILSQGNDGYHSAAVATIKDYTASYSGEFARWRDGLKCGWLLAKAPAGLNERAVEWPWVLDRAAKLPKRGQLLEVGSYQTEMPERFHTLGYTVTALDINPMDRGLDGIKVVGGDIRSTTFPDMSFDAISCISTLEHIGIANRYGITDADARGDSKALSEMARLLKPGGVLWLTVPYGCRDVLPINRCYDETRLTQMIKDFSITESAFYIPQHDATWKECSSEVASAWDWYSSHWYALGLFELRKGLK